MSEVSPADQGRPRCLLCLVQTSGSMFQKCTIGEHTPSRIRAARMCVEKVLERLVRRAKANDPNVAELEVAAVGYSLADDGFVELAPLLPDGNRLPGWVRVSDLVGAEIPRRRGKYRAWLDSIQMSGEPSEGSPPDFGLVWTEAWGWLVTWLQHHPLALAPVVVHVGDGMPARNLSEILESAPNLMRADGQPVIRFHCLFSDQEAIQFPDPVLESGEDWNDWAELATIIHLPDSTGKADQRAVRAFTRNELPSTIISQVVTAKDSPPPAPAEVGELGDAVPVRIRMICEAKRGNQAQECEDACAADEVVGRVAVCDGAGEGIFSRLWAGLLTERYLEEGVNLGDREQLEAWVLARRREFFERIDFGNLRYTQQMKVERTGAATTFVAWELGPTGSDGTINWRAWAIGDSCLFWVREGRLLASFPLAASSHFALAPALLRTKPTEPVPALLSAEGTCLPDDVFVLATDAVAKRLLRDVERGVQPDWNELERIAPDDWRACVERWRDEGEIENDDSSFAFVRVAMTEAGPEPD